MKTKQSEKISVQTREERKKRLSDFLNRLETFGRQLDEKAIEQKVQNGLSKEEAEGQLADEKAQWGREEIETEFFAQERDKQRCFHNL